MLTVYREQNYTAKRRGKAGQALIRVYIYRFTGPSSAQVGLNVEFVAKRDKLQYAVRSISKVQIT
jgi:hypothetical protein